MCDVGCGVWHMCGTVSGMHMSDVYKVCVMGVVWFVRSGGVFYVCMICILCDLYEIYVVICILTVWCVWYMCFVCGMVSVECLCVWMGGWYVYCLCACRFVHVCGVFPHVCGVCEMCVWYMHVVNMWYDVWVCDVCVYKVCGVWSVCCVSLKSVCGIYVLCGCVYECVVCAYV